MEKIFTRIKGLFMILALFLFLSASSSPVMAQWSCDTITIEPSGTSTITYTINVNNTLNSITVSSMVIEYNTEELTFLSGNATGCLPDDYNHIISITESAPGIINASTITLFSPPIPDSVTGCLFHLEFTNLIDPDIPEICITSLDDDLTGWCGILPTCCHVEIDPPSAMVKKADTIDFTATSPYCDVNDGDYTWSIDDPNNHGSIIDPTTGLYTAGCSLSQTIESEHVYAIDSTNNNIEGIAVVDMLSCWIRIFCDGCTTFIRPAPQTTLQFSIVQKSDGCLNDSIPEWSIVNSGGTEGSDIGSTIDENGLYTAGSHLGATIMENVKAKDTNNCCGDECAITEIEVGVLPCTLNIKRPKDPVITGAGGTVSFIKDYNCCLGKAYYDWDLSVDAGIGSTVNANGVYRAGEDFANCGTAQETVKLSSWCPENGDVREAEKNVSVTSCVVAISPNPAEVKTGETILLTASHGCIYDLETDCDNDACYTWEVSDGKGNETSTDGPTYTWSESDVGTTVTLTDTCNNNASDTVIVQVSTTTTTSPPLPQCTSDAFCLDGRFCNGTERCAGGRCQPGSDPCPDDGLFCNGEEGCDEDGDVCTQSGDPCIGTETPICDEEKDVCGEEVECLIDADCNNGLFCDGAETCVDGVCQDGEPVTCEEDGEFCNGVEECDEDTDACISPGDPCIGTETPDCNEVEDICQPETPLPLEFELFPKSTVRSHLVPLPLVMFIVSTDPATEFKFTSTEVSVGDALTPPLALVLSKNSILVMSLVLPPSLGDPSDTVDVTVTTDSGQGTEILTLNLLPLFLGE